MDDLVTFRIKGAEVEPEIKMPPSATILALKQKIERDLKVRVERQIILWPDKILVDDDPIGYYDFGRSTSVRLFVDAAEPAEKEYSINLKSSIRPESNIKVKGSYKVRDLKSEVEKLWEVPKRDINLFRFSKKMEDDYFLSSYYVYEGAQVFVELDINNPSETADPDVHNHPSETGLP